MSDLGCSQPCCWRRKSFWNNTPS